jgi:hypothetical protein
MGFWMMMGLVSTLALVLGGLYTLYCMSRYASSMDRLASAVEELVKRQQGPAAETPIRPSVPSAPVPPVPPSGPAPTAVVPAPSAASYNTIGTNPTGTPPSAASSSAGGINAVSDTNTVSGTNAERQNDEYPR